MNNFNKILFIMFLIGVGITFILISNLEKNTKELRRVKSNIEIINSSIKYFLDSQGRLAAKNDILLLKANELKKQYPRIINEIKNLQVKPQRINNYTESGFILEKNISTIIRDSIITDTVKARVFNYNDVWYKISGIAIKDSQYVSISSQDTIIQITYKGERFKPYLWFLSKRRLQQKILNKNPNNKIIYNKTILITK